MKNRFFVIQLLLIVMVNSLLGNNVQRVWIYFADKGQIESKDITVIAKQHLSERSISRRAKKSISIEYDFTDLPVNQN